MRLYNTLTGAVEELTPVTPGRVGIYACGVTPYSESHVGHAMSAIVYDVFVRYLRWPGNPAGGYEVTFVSNYTDVDDKLIDRGHELGIDPLDLAEQNITLWEEQQRALNLTFPDVRPRVTTHIEAIVALTQRLIDTGHAYATPSGDVYFRVRSHEDYGKLSHRNIEELRAGTRFEPGGEKEFPLDFALWKAAKPGEPSWESPWGRGRPGWHIECSAMSQRYLGETFDVHGGGLDLVFPHHENEIAQSESATGKPFARIWMHSGLVQRDGEKMSKSVGNVVNVSEALARWSPDALRLFVLNSHYRNPNNLTDEAMAAAERGVERLTGALRSSEGGAPSTLDGSEERARFVAAMDDDFNTAQALAALFELARKLNRARDAGEDVGTGQAVLRELTCVLGLTLEEPTSSVDLDIVALSRLASRLGVQCGGTDAESTIDALLSNRMEARKGRDFARADAIRDGLAEAGIEVEDTPDGPRWSVRR
ncbi:MAG: cysteine--tRNA ligase [Dehalococcoidia bacterium]